MESDFQLSSIPDLGKEKCKNEKEIQVAEPFTKWDCCKVGNYYRLRIFVSNNLSYSAAIQIRKRLTAVEANVMFIIYAVNVCNIIGIVEEINKQGRLVINSKEG